MNKRSIQGMLTGTGVAAICAVLSQGVAHAEGKQPTQTGHAASMNKAELNDAQILGIADAANGGEVEQATLAGSRAHAQSVKSFAAMMVKDHTAAKQKGATIARQLGVTLAASDKRADVEKDGAEVMSDLQKTDAGDFDRTYMKAQVKEHEKVLKVLDKELIPHAASPDVKALLTDMKMHVQHHLSAAHAALDQLPK